MNQESKRPVTLEDILRLKQAERPPAEFWNQFDRQLRAKQLAAIVEKRPWWRTLSLPLVLAEVRRYHLPLGAVAVLAVTVLSVREYRAPTAVPASAQGNRVERVVAAAAVSTSAPTLSAVELARGSAVASVVDFAHETAPAAVPLAPGFEAAHLADLTQMIPVLGAKSVVVDPAPFASITHLKAENFVALQNVEPALSRQLLSPARGFETRVLPGRARPVEPLAQMKVPSGSHRSNVIASATLASTTAPVLASERSARGLSDERLYDTISRFNARGAGVLVKF